MFEMNFSCFHSTDRDNSVIYSFKDIPIPADFYPNLPYIFRAILYRNKMNMNTFILIVGAPRTSKSFGAMKIAEVYLNALCKEFDVKKELTFDDIKKFFKWSQGATDSAFILDETGSTMSPDQFWTLSSRLMRKFVQTQGFRKNLVIWVMPNICFLQKNFRFMCNYALKTLNQGTAEVYKIVVDQLLGKGYPDRIETLTYGYPSEKVCEEYTQMKIEWNDMVLADDIAFMDKMEKRSDFNTMGGLMFSQP